MSTLKTQPSPIDPVALIQGNANKTRAADGLILLDMFQRETGLVPIVWGPSIIGFGEYTYTLASGKQEKFMRTGFSPRKQNLSLYIASGINSRPDLAEKLGKYKSSKACTYINKLADVDLQVLAELIRADIAAMALKYPE